MRANVPDQVDSRGSDGRADSPGRGNGPSTVRREAGRRTWRERGDALPLRGARLGSRPARSYSRSWAGEPWTVLGRDCLDAHGQQLNGPELPEHPADPAAAFPRSSTTSSTP